MGPFGKGRELFNFSMSRAYDIDFMTEEDLLTLFNSKELSYIPRQRSKRGMGRNASFRFSCYTSYTNILL